MTEEKQSKKFKSKKEEDQYVSPDDRWMVWPKPPTLYEQYKGLTREHVRQAIDVKYDCPACKAPRNVIYSHVEFNKKIKIEDRESVINSKHLAAFCKMCKTPIRFVRDTASRWQAMRENEGHGEQRTRRRNRGGKTKKSFGKQQRTSN